MNKTLGIKEIITITIGVISLIIPSYFFFITSREELRNQAIIVFIGILIFLIIGMTVIYAYTRWSNLTQTVNSNRNKINQIEEDLKDTKSSFKLDKRMAITEELIDKFIKNKKAELNIDPQVVIWIGLILLLLLFLKTAGVFG